MLPLDSFLAVLYSMISGRIAHLTRFRRIKGGIDESNQRLASAVSFRIKDEIHISREVERSDSTISVLTEGMVAGATNQLIPD